MRIQTRFRRGRVFVDVLAASIRHGPTRDYVLEHGRPRRRGWYRLTWAAWRGRPMNGPATPGAPGAPGREVCHDAHVA